MTNLSAIGIGVFSGIIFMIKVGALYFFTEYLRDKAKEKLDNNKSGASKELNLNTFN